MNYWKLKTGALEAFSIIFWLMIKGVKENAVAIYDDFV